MFKLRANWGHYSHPCFRNQLSQVRFAPFPFKFSKEKNVNVAEVNQQRYSEESGVENVD